MTDLRDQEKTFLREELQKVTTKLELSEALILWLVANPMPKSETTDDVKEWNNKRNEALVFIGVKKGEG